MKVAYWPGCVSRGFTPELHGSMAKVAPLLDIELIELDRAACCGAGVIAEHNQELADTLNARTFALAQKTDGELMMNICSTCQGAQSECQERLDANTEYREHVNTNLSEEGLRYEKGPEQQELPLAAGRGDRARRGQGQGQAPAQRPPGRPVLRLLHRATGRSPGDRRRAPARPLHALVIEALGGTVIDYAGVYKCCGFPIITMNKQASLAHGRAPPRRRDRRRSRLPGGALPPVPPEPRPPAAGWRPRPSGATSGCRCCTCPSWSGLALGSTPKELGMNKHVVKPTSVIDWTSSVVAGAPA